MSNLKTVVYQRLEAIAAAEKITRVELREMSRELLIYVPETQDIDIVNRLIGVLTPMNAKTAVLYFAHFLPWDKETDNDGNFVRFGSKHQGDKRVNKKLDAIAEFLKADNNNIWTWAETNVEVKQKDFGATITRAVKAALKGDEKSDTDPLTVDQVVTAVLDGGVTLADMLAIMEPMQQQMEEIQAAEAEKEAA